MERRYILTAFGKDRPGVVADVSRLIFECGLNLEDLTMKGSKMSLRSYGFLSFQSKHILHSSFV